MSVIIDTTKSELEAVIRYARVGANNCMICNSWEVTDLVRCEDCKWWREETDHTCRKWGGASPRKANGYCDDGERRSE